MSRPLYWGLSVVGCSADLIVTTNTHRTDFFCPQIGVKPLVTGGEDRVVACIEPYTVVPARARPFGAGCIHVAYQVRVVGDQ